MLKSFPVGKKEEYYMDQETIAKYYTPTIEDIRVGYECELLWNQNMLPEEDWYPIIVGDNQTEDFDLIDYYGRVANSRIRTLYLTKEQIEAEGWEITFSEVKPKPYKVDWINARKGHFNLWINLALVPNNILGIDGFYGILYRGKCPSINEFRYICKLLGI